MKEALQEFTKYTNQYLSYGKMIDLKIRHTKRVTHLCEELADFLKLSKEEKEVAFYCGLLHDIGRFEQWKNYSTFSDTKSIDHGDLGYKILKEKDYISVYTKKSNYNKVILKAVKNHNKVAIPNNYTKEEKLFCKIIRDADKLDILYLLVKDELDFPSENTTISKKVWDTFMKRESINRYDVKTKADRIAVLLAFPFNVNYSYSFNIIKKKDYMNQLMDKIEKEASKEFREQLKIIRPIINQYIEERCTC